MMEPDAGTSKVNDEPIWDGTTPAHSVSPPPPPPPPPEPPSVPASVSPPPEPASVPPSLTPPASGPPDPVPASTPAPPPPAPPVPEELLLQLAPQTPTSIAAKTTETRECTPMPGPLAVERNCCRAHGIARSGQPLGTTGSQSRRSQRWRGVLVGEQPVSAPLC